MATAPEDTLNADTGQGYGEDDRSTGRAPQFGVEDCGAYRQDICGGYGADDFCDNCRYVNEFVDWWSREATALREFHDLLHGTGTVESSD